MKNIQTENSENIKTIYIHPPFECICHHCSNKIETQQQLTCSNQICSNRYCISCLVNFYQKTTPLINFIQNKDLSKFWKCPACEGKCCCNKCKLRLPSIKEKTEDKNKNNNFLGKKINSDAELIMWLSSGEDKNIDTQNVKFPFLPLNSKIKSKVFDKLIKIAKQCELFYRHKCKNEYIKKNCANCFETYFHQNDLLRFFNYETFLYYMKYLFYVSNKIVGYSKDNFNKNKNDFEILFQKMKKKEEIWAFKDTKIICKQCMYFLINKPNFFQNIKDIFLKKEKKIFFFSNNIELNEEKSCESNINKQINNNIDNKTKWIDSILISKNIFKIKKEPKNKLNKNINQEENNKIIINYNNHNNNICNTLIFNNEYKISNNHIFGINTFWNSNQLPFINNFYLNSNNNFFNNFPSCINYNYIQSLFFGLKKEITDILGIVNLSKKDKNNKLNYLSKVSILNQNIINYFKLIEENVITNLNFLKCIILKFNVDENNKEFIEIKPKIIELILDNRKFLTLLNSLKFNYLNVENVFIRTLFQ